ncbi:MAG: ComEA family DNA-binding protein [Xanthomonadales bacterium]|nr:ComEA family DNA-binding protein [Xanthomonadales bacterium]
MQFFKTLFLSLALLAGAAFAGEPVNVNTASAQEMADALTGIGMTKAEAIIDYREANGPFQHVDELVNVKGIGLKTVDRNRDFILLDGEARSTASNQDS